MKLYSLLLVVLHSTAGLQAWGRSEFLGRGARFRRQSMVPGASPQRMPSVPAGGGLGDDDDDDDIDQSISSDMPDMSAIDQMDMEELMSRLRAEGLDGMAANTAPMSGSGLNYEWQQNTESMLVSIFVPSETVAKDIKVEYPTTRKIRVSLHGDIIVEGDLGGKIDREESFWVLEPSEDETRSIIALEMTKFDENNNNWPNFIQTDAFTAKITDTAFFDIQIAGEDAGRIELGLFGNDLPLTVANFKALCTDHSPNYKDSPFHRIIPGFMIQGGDITKGDGSGGTSIYGDSFDDEAFTFRHTAPGLLSMANAGPNSQSSQFFITRGATPWLDNKHVIFGRVLAGDDIIALMEARGSTSGDVVDGPVTVKDCGLI